MNRGRTTTAINLARMLIQIRKRTLMLDNTLKRLHIHCYFELSNNTGASCVIIGNSCWKDDGRFTSLK